MAHDDSFQYVGKPVARREGLAKLTGRARYVDDMKTPGALTGRTVRSTISAGRIKSIRFREGVPWEQIVVVTARDVPYNTVSLIEEDQPALADEIIRHREEPILLVAHEDPAIAREAAAAVEIEYETETSVLTMGPGKIMKRIEIDHGDVQSAFADAGVVLEGTYTTGAQEHVYIEPNGCIAWWDDDAVTIHASQQCPYYIHKAVKKAFALTDDKVRVVQEATGGGFGGKEEFPNVLAIHAALLSRKAGGRPVRLMYDRQEDLAASTKRHPSRTRIRTACTRDGNLQALELHFDIDGGAYVTVSPVVLSRGLLHAFGPYRWPAAHLVGRCYVTNSPPYGAFRGFGAPQSQFALECHLNRLADHLGLDPAELRRRNFIHAGDTLPTGQIMKEEPFLSKLLDRALELGNYSEVRSTASPGEGRGIGVSASFHGTGFTGSGEDHLRSIVAIEAHADGTVEILVASTEMGQGTETIFCQMTAEAAGVPIESVRFRQPDTSAVPNSGPTVASRTCAVVGKLLEQAARALREKVGNRTIAEAVAAEGCSIRLETRFKQPADAYWDEANYKGSAYGAYSYCINVVEATVDAITSVPRVERVVGVYDIGRVINPTLALGQVEGGMAQAVGWATCEDVVLQDGIMANARMTNYIIPTTADAPEIVGEFMENPSEVGGFGSKGVGELPMDGPAAAVVAAINRAYSCDLTQVPALPEHVLTASVQKAAL